MDQRTSAGGHDPTDAGQTGRAALRLAAPGLDVVLESPDPDATADFYESVLGGHSAPDARRWQAERAVGFGEQVIAIRRSLQPERVGPRGIYEAHGLRVIAFLLEDFEAVCTAIEDRGRRVSRAEGLPGRLSIAFARDLDSNTLELIGVPGAGPPRCPLQIGMTVRDPEQTRDWYRRVFGFEEQPSAPIAKGVIRHGLNIGQSTLKFWKPPKPPGSTAPTKDGDVGIVAVALRVGDLGQAKMGMRERGITLTGDLALLEDPDGNRLEFVEGR